MRASAAARNHTAIQEAQRTGYIILIMYATCLFCTSRLGTNEIIEAFPIGRRLAFDAARGRLWVVCLRCERWNLTPLEERWEAVEDCERHFSAARKRVTSENIGIARMNDGLDLVRIGDPLRREFAAWRYGDQFGRRRKRAIAGSAAVVVATGAAIAGSVAIGALSVGGYWLFDVGNRIARAMRDRRVIARIPTDEGKILTVLGQHVREARISTDIVGTDGWKLELVHVEGGYTMRGIHALHATGLIMPKLNGRGATQFGIERAIKRLEAFDDPVQYMRSAAAFSSHASRPGDSLTKLPTDIRLAMEMAANEENERCALEGEMALLEMAWEEAEEIAQIADNLTLSQDVVRQLEELQRARAERESGA